MKSFLCKFWKLSCIFSYFLKWWFPVLWISSKDLLRINVLVVGTWDFLFSFFFFLFTFGFVQLPQCKVHLLISKRRMVALIMISWIFESWSWSRRFSIPKRLFLSSQFSFTHQIEPKYCQVRMHISLSSPSLHFSSATLIMIGPIPMLGILFFSYIDQLECFIYPPL